MMAHGDLPACRRCGRLAETCIYYDAAGCIGVPKRPREDAPSAAERRYWSALDRHHGIRNLGGDS